MISILLAKKIIEFFIFILLGFLLVRCNVFKSADSEIMAKICIYLMTPAIIINAFQIDIIRNVFELKNMVCGSYASNRLSIGNTSFNESSTHRIMVNNR